MASKLRVIGANAGGRGLDSFSEGHGFESQCRVYLMDVFHINLL